MGSKAPSEPDTLEPHHQQEVRPPGGALWKWGQEGLRAKCECSLPNSPLELIPSQQASVSFIVPAWGSCFGQGPSVL